MKRKFRRLFCVLSLVLLMVQLGFAQETLTFLSRGANEASVRTLVDAWNASHDPKIEVTIVPDGQFVTKLATSIAGGASPDIVSIDLVFTPAFMNTNQLTDITDLAQSLPYFANLSPSHIALGTWSDGNIYALPFTAEGSILLYNKDLFKQAGLDPEQPPTTWDEIYEAAKAIRALGDDVYGFYFAGACGGCNGFTFLPLIWASGGDVLSADYSQPTLTDPAVKEALEFYKKLWDEGLVPESAKVDNGTDFFNAFTSGKIGMAGSGAFSINALKADYPDLDFGLAFLPGKDGGQSSFAGGDNIAIPTGSRNVEAAFEFIRWVLSDEVQLEQYAKNNQLPVRTDLAENEYFAADPRLTTAAQAMALGRTPYSVRINDLFNDANGPWLQLLQTAIFDGDVDGAIEEAQSNFERIME